MAAIEQKIKSSEQFNDGDDDDYDDHGNHGNGHLGNHVTYGNLKVMERIDEAVASVETMDIMTSILLEVKSMKTWINW